MFSYSKLGYISRSCPRGGVHYNLRWKTNYSAALRCSVSANLQAFSSLCQQPQADSTGFPVQMFPKYDSRMDPWIYAYWKCKGIDSGNTNTRELMHNNMVLRREQLETPIPHADISLSSPLAVHLPFSLSGTEEHPKGKWRCTCCKRLNEFNQWYCQTCISMKTARNPAVYTRGKLPALEASKEETLAEKEIIGMLLQRTTMSYEASRQETEAEKEIADILTKRMNVSKKEAELLAQKKAIKLKQKVTPVRAHLPKWAVQAAAAPVAYTKPIAPPIDPMLFQDPLSANDYMQRIFGDRQFDKKSTTGGLGGLTQTDILRFSLRRDTFNRRKHLKRAALLQSNKESDIKNNSKAVEKYTPTAMLPVIPAIKITSYPIELKTLAQMCGKKISDVIACAERFGEEGLTNSSPLEPDLAELIALEFGAKVTRLSQRDLTRQSSAEKLAKKHPSRAPVICVMGHVDHGKTTLLDFLRKTNVASTEEGGITQRLAAFTVNDTLGGRPVTFLDTPGHAAFTKMRNSGAQVTDIVCLAIAADDGVSAQTKEVLELVKTFKLSLVVALTKIDKAGIVLEEAMERIQNQLLEHGFVCESYKGDVPVVPVSGVTGQGMAQLTEVLGLQSEVMELQADPEGRAEALVLDARLDHRLGPVVDIVVTWGSLRPGDKVVVGTQSGTIRNLIGADGTNLTVAGPSTPARLIGLKTLPDAGDDIIEVQSEAEGHRIADIRARKSKKEEADDNLNVPVKTGLSEQPKESQSTDQAGKKTPEKPLPRIVPIVLKADADGVLDALAQALEGIQDKDVALSIVHRGVGPVSKKDIDCTSIAEGKATIFCFNVGTDSPTIKSSARNEGIEIRQHKVIYHLIDDVKSLMSEYVPEEVIEENLGNAEILQVFELMGSEKGTVVAGCRIASGKIHAADNFRIKRDGVELFATQGLASLRINKKQVDEVGKGMECGMCFTGYTGFKIGDEIECFKTERRKRVIK